MALAVVAARLEPAEATRVCTQAAHILTDAFIKDPGFPSRGNLAEGLIAVAARMKTRRSHRRSHGRTRQRNDLIHPREFGGESGGGSGPPGPRGSRQNIQRVSPTHSPRRAGRAAQEKFGGGFGGGGGGMEPVEARRLTDALAKAAPRPKAISNRLGGGGDRSGTR